MQRPDRRARAAGANMGQNDVGRGNVSTVHLAFRWRRLMASQPLHAMSLRTALDLDVFKTLSDDDGAPKSSARLAAAKGADPVLVGRC